MGAGFFRPYGFGPANFTAGGNHMTSAGCNLRGLALTVNEGDRVLLSFNGVHAWVGLSRIAGSKARVVIDAPRSVSVTRESLIKESEKCRTL